MDSRLHGVPLSTTQMTPNVTVSRSLSGIRAPLTMDDSDFEYSVSTKSLKNNSVSSYSSGSDMEYEGFVSGEDEFESASERHFGTDDEILEETHFVKEYAFSRPVVKSPGEEIVQKSSNVSEYAFNRPFVRNPDGEIVQESDDDNEYAFSGPSVKSPDEEIIEERNSDKVKVAVYGDSNLSVSVVNNDEDILENGPTSVVDIGVSLLPKMVMPIALVSGDSDDDSPRSEAMEDDGFSAVVRIPSTEMLQRVNSAPKVRILEVEEEEGDESQSQHVVEPEFVEESAPYNILNGVLGSKYEEEEGDESQSQHMVEPDFVEESAPNKDLNGVLSSKYEEEESNELQSQHMVEPEFVEDSAPNNILNGILSSKYKEEEGNESQSHEVVEPQFFEDLSPNNILNGVLSSKYEEEEGNESQSHDVVQPKFVEDLAPNNILNGVLNSKYEEEEGNESQSHVEEPEFVKDSAPNIILNGVLSSKYEEACGFLEDTVHKGANTIEEGKSKSLVVSKNCDSLKELLSNEDASQLNEEIHSSGKIADLKKCVCSDNSRECNDLTSCVNEETEDIKSLGTAASLTLEAEDGPPHETINPSLQDLEVEVVSLDDGNCRNSNIGVDKSDNGVVKFTGEVDVSLLHDENERAVAVESRLPSTSFLKGESSGDRSQEIDWWQVMTDSDEEVYADREVDGKQIHDSAALAALLKATVRSDSEETLSKDDKEKLEYIQQTRVRYLRLVHRLGQSPEDPISAQVLYQLVFAAGRPSAQEFSLECAKTTAIELEEQIENDLNFSLNILVIGKTGVGKSATINSIFGEKKALIDAFEPATTDVKLIIGSLDGVKIRVLDTPGLRTSFTEQSINRRILLSIKKFMRKCPPDVVLYVDRLDSPTRDLTDLPIMKSVTTYLGSSIWHNAVIALTHAASTLPDGPSGNPLSYDVFVAQRSRVVQQLISHSAGDMHVMNPVALVENHHFVKKNKDGEIWRSQLLLLCYSMKILSEVNSVVKNRDPLDRTNLFGFSSPSLPYLLSSLLQSNVHPKLSSGGENLGSDIELEYSSDTDKEDDDDYDQLPPFKPLKKSQIAKLSREQRKAYFEEYDYRVKLLQKKQWREEMKRLRDMNKKGKYGLLDHGFMEEDANEEAGTPAPVAVPLPDLVLPPSFDGDNPSFRYRVLESSSHLLAGPVFDSQGWDHDCGYDGVIIEDRIAIASRFPSVISVQLTKDKKKFNMHLNSSVSSKHGDKGSTMAGLEIQTLGKQFAYTLKGDMKIQPIKMNKTSAGVSITFLGENVTPGLKVEDQIAVGKWLLFVGNAGAIQSQGDAAYGANLEVHLREKDYPIGKDQSSLGLSLMRWRGDFIWGCNLQSQFSIGRDSKLNVQAGLNNKLSGQISVRMSSSEQLQIAVLCLLPIAKAIFRSVFLQSTENNST
ncbi:Translocase of chloroplast [Abeliophyllum distichum]|uniref:Translocase of chloroplast n=1 Tax=Abeliophyllum distichum TaxID=126358 RepID=A0ABD1Q2E0_9LAMI